MKDIVHSILTHQILTEVFQKCGEGIVLYYFLGIIIEEFLLSLFLITLPLSFIIV